ncbi:unnamed protein product [Ectocarpus sp. CCAP 1310/34]|nr:unnamed protein product [Ectocarpus sp. CCAP 1310/34]
MKKAALACCLPFLLMTSLLGAALDLRRRLETTRACHNVRYTVKTSYGTE